MITKKEGGSESIPDRINSGSECVDAIPEEVIATIPDSLRLQKGDSGREIK